MRRGWLAAWLAVWPACVGICAARPGPTSQPAGSSIPESQIAALEARQLGQGDRSSVIQRRMALKSAVRRGEALLKAHPAADNRYRVLGIVFQSQKRLLGLENTARNREALLETCEKLAQAPDQYADLRLEADLLLSDRDLTAKGATLADRAKALEAIVERYRGTSAEAKSLMMAALIAPKLDALGFQKKIHDALAERFAGDPAVIEWRREHLGVGMLDVLFAGAFTRADGAVLHFPTDTMGHTCLMYFWSKRTPGFEKKLTGIKDLQSQHPGQLEVYSFNLDELPDAGAKILRSLGLKWTALHLPGGRRSQTYRTYATRDPLGVRVNALGHALLQPTLISDLAKIKSVPGDYNYGRTPLEQNLDDVRYLSQLQSLFVGDFLVASEAAADEASRTAKSVPEETLDAIRACFAPAPFRFRLTREQALAGYAKAEKLCRDAMERYPEAPELWRVRNARIVALLGMWNVGVEPKYLERAVAEAHTALAAARAPGADVVPRFCLAKQAIRQARAHPESVVSAFVEACGGPDASALTYAAAAILAMDANARALHNRYRDILLKRYDGEAAMWPVVSFLRDQNHRFRLFQANYYLPPSQGRRAMRAALRRNARSNEDANATRLLKAEFRTLAGGTLRLPQAGEGRLTLLLFVEPPAGSDAEFSVAINGAVIEDSRGRKKQIAGAMQKAFELADRHGDRKVKVIAAFLSDDTARAAALAKKLNWPCQVVLVPGGLANPLVRRLGILNADHMPNAVLLRTDGTIAWTLSGLVHPQLRSEGVGELTYAAYLGMSANIDQCELAEAIDALKRGKFEQAARFFSPPEPKSAKRPRPDGWTAPRLEGRALARMGMKDWGAALADIDAAIEAHQAVRNAGKPCACQCVADMRLVRAAILDELGRSEQARAERKLAAGPVQVHHDSWYEAFHDRLKAFWTKAGHRP